MSVLNTQGVEGQKAKKSALVGLTTGGFPLLITLSAAPPRHLVRRILASPFLSFLNERGISKLRGCQQVERA
jgi:hypothetical protein